MPEAPCLATARAGAPCQAPRLLDDDRCFWHSDATADERREAQRLGGLRRRREGAVAGAYAFSGVRTHADLQRLLEIAALDALGLENSIARVRALVAVVGMGTKLVEASDLAERVASLEAALHPDTGG